MVKLHKYTSKKLIFIVKQVLQSKKLNFSFVLFFLDLRSRFFLLPKKQRKIKNMKCMHSIGCYVTVRIKLHTTFHAYKVSANLRRENDHRLLTSSSNI